MPGEYMISRDLFLLDRLIAFSVGALFLLIAFIYLLKLLEAWLLHKSFREALQRDPAVAASLISHLESSEARQKRQRGDDRTGLLLIAIGSALIGFTLVVNDPLWIRYGVGSALFPILTGLALVARQVWLRRVAGRGGVKGD